MIRPTRFSFAPFHPRPLEAAWIAATALGVSLLARLYPAAGKCSAYTPHEMRRNWLFAAIVSLQYPQRMRRMYIHELPD